MLGIPQSKKNFLKAELLMLLEKRFSGKLAKEEPERLAWLVQLFSLKELPELAKSASFEAYKKNTKTKKKDVSFDQVNFFSVQELPEAFNYLEAKATLRHCQATVRSDELNLEMISNSVVAEYKARTRGQDLLLSVFSIAANIQKRDQVEKDFIALGEPGPNGEGLLSLVLRQEKSQSLVFGRVRRALFFYRSEISNLLHRFMSVLEESLASVGADTQEILGAGTSSGTSTQIINVHVEAPILFFPEKDKLWVADLGTFDVKQDSPEVNPHGLMFLEGRQTQLYFQPKDRTMNSLNAIKSDPTSLPSLLKSMSLTISDLGFRIEVGVVRTPKTAASPARSIPSYQVDCRPFHISLTQHSLTSLYTLQASLIADLSRQQEWLERTKKRADWSHAGLDYDQGYEQWARSELLLVGRLLHVVERKKGGYLGSIDLGSVVETKVDEVKMRLVLILKGKRVEFRADQLQALKDVKFKVDGIMKLITEENKKPKDETQQNVVQDAEQPTQGEDFVIGLRMSSVELVISEYSEDTVPFGVLLSGVSYKSEWINQIEQGELRLQSASVRSLQGQEVVIKVKEQNPAILYSFVYRSGLLKQKMVLGQLDTVYKPKYIQSALKLIEVLASIFLSTSENPAQVESQEDTPITSTIRKETNVMIQTIKTSIHYKGDMKNLEFTTTGLETDLISQGDQLDITVRISGVGLYDLHKYPFREDQTGVFRVPLLQMKKSGSVEVSIFMNSTDISVETKVKQLVVDWVQQRFMRFIDFLMYQVLEVLYPSLFSLAQFYSRDKVVKMSLGLLNDPSIVKQKITLESTELNLISTTNTDHKIGLMIQTTTVTNSRVLIAKIANKPKYFPLGDLESDRWDVEMNGVQLNIVDETLLDEMVESKHKAVEAASEKFDLSVSVDFLAKLFELSFLYEIVDDLQNFTPEELEVVRAREPAFLNGIEAFQMKVKPSVAEIDAQVQQYLLQSEKERLAVDGRYRIKIRSSRIGLYLTNRFINKMYNISSNNIAFDDGKDQLLRQVYVSSTQGLQVFVGMKVDVFEALAPDYKRPEQTLFRLTLQDLHMLVDKLSTYTNYIDLDAKSLTMRLDDSLEIPAQYQDFIKSRVSEDDARGFMCKMQLYPDYRKDIQVDCYGVRLIVFQFLLRLLPELTTLEPYIEHPGYEDPNYSHINIHAQLHDTELCLVSQKEGCVVMAGKLDYHIEMDAIAGDHTISLQNMECLDCPEQLYFTNPLENVPKRTISRKFDLVFKMRSDIYLNVDYALEIGNVLLKLTAFNLRTFSEVGAYQAELVNSTMKYSLIDPNTVPVLLWKTKAKLDIGGLSLMYVDNYRDIFIPALRLDLDVDNFEYKQDETVTEMYSSLRMKASFNNSRTAKWEPFLESFPLDIEMRTLERKTLVKMLGGEMNTDEGLYLNFGEELLEVLLHCARNASNVFLERSLVATEEGIIYDSQFLVRNKTGYDIVVQTIGDRESNPAKVKNLAERFVNFIIEDEFSNIQQSKRLLKVSLAPETEHSEILEFSVDKVGQHEKLIGNHHIVITVKKEQLKRVAVISSKVIIQNFTKLPLELMLFDGSGVHDKKIISDEKERFPVKFDKMDSILTIALENAVAPQLKIGEILASKARRTIKIPLVCASEDYNSLAMEVYTKGLVTFFEIKPALRICNLSPLELRLVIFKQTKIIENLVIGKMDLVEVFRYDPYKEESLFQIEAGEQYASEFLDLKKLLARPNLESSKIIFIKKNAALKKGEMYQEPMQFTLEVVNNKKENTLTLFSKTVVINETGVDNLIFGTADSKTPKSCHTLACPDGKLLFLSNEKHYNLTVSSQDEVWRGQFAVLPKDQAVETFVKIGSSKLQLELTVQPRVIKLVDTYPMKVLTFLPKHIAVNESSSLISFVQSDGQQFQLEPGARKPIIWNSELRMISIKPRNDEGEESSEKFDMGQPGHYELKLAGEFYKLKVSSQEGCTFCHVSTIEAELVTKKIDNKTPYTIRVRSKADLLEPPQEIQSGACKPFAQKHPIKAGAIVMLDILVPNEDKTDVLTCEANCLILTPTPRLVELGMSDYLLRICVAFQGAHTVVSVDLVSRQQTPEPQKEDSTELRLRVNMVNISVLHAPHKQRRKEVLNLMMAGVWFNLSSSGTSYKIAGLVEELQLDNTSDTSCPVVLKSGGLSTRKNVAPKPFLEWSISLQDPAKSSHLYLSEVAFVLGSLELKIEEEFVDAVTTLSNSLSSRASSGQPQAQKDYFESKYFSKALSASMDSQEQPQPTDRLLWQQTKLDAKNNFVYIDNLILPSVRCLLSYYQDPSSTYSKDFTFVSLLAVAVGGFEQFPLDMKGLHSE